MMHSEKGLLETGSREDAVGGVFGTIYDDAFKTECEKLKPLLVPLINEIFGTEFDVSVVEIDRMADEHHLTTEEGEDIRNITDACLKIDGDYYHIECQSTEDGGILIRLVRYNSMIALESIRYAPDGKSLIVEYPRSALVALRGSGGKISHALVEHRHDAGTVTERIAVMNVPEYSMDDIFDKGLFFLVPFYPMRYEKELDKIRKNPLESGSEYDKICVEMENFSKRLDEAVKDCKITENEARDLRVLVRNVLEHISRKLVDDNGRLVNSMGGRVLELPSDQLRRERAIGFREGETSGEARGEARGEAIGIDKKTITVIRNMILRGQSDEDIKAIAECSQEQIDDVRKAMG